ncbi:amino acid permease [Sporanaerobacter sp. PP17-6a]|uniref:amino acid permease n=1 Tax=Sporanaerobacter sp. PP17-6a TaxID=1891289 RepID=UPI00089FC6BA|nr:amino acid permease [Sporanaerobacter sp. PP17-6a]SCL90502.1 Arginine/agmatine antiporter [Sporanaerobacter sp. PP17-6a]
MGDNGINKKEKVELKKEIGIAGAVSIIVGNMIGSGIYMTPQTLASASNPKSTMIAWVITAVGSILVALVFARLGEKYPVNGGPVVYTRDAFGDFAAFLTVWTYWIGAWICDAAVITGFLSYLSFFIPILNQSRLLAFLASTLTLWLFTGINIKGSKEVGIVAVITTVCKIVPLLIFIIIAAMHFEPSNLSTVSSEALRGTNTVSVAVGITLWAFLGLDSVSVAAGDIKNPKKNVKKATILGIIGTSIIYMGINFFAMGAVSQGYLAKSTAPLADVINKATGSSWGGGFVAIGAIIATLGATSGWILITARVALSAGEDNLFPEVFGKISPKTHTPINALVISAIAANILLLLNFVGSLQMAYNFMVLIGTLAFLPAYAFSAVGEIVLLAKKSDKFNFGIFLKNSFMSLIAFIYVLYAIYGIGANAVMWGFILMLAGIPFFVYMKVQKINEADKN